MRAAVLFNLYESAKALRLHLTEHFKLYNPTRMSFAHTCRLQHDKTKTFVQEKKETCLTVTIKKI